MPRDREVRKNDIREEVDYSSDEKVDGALIELLINKEERQGMRDVAQEEMSQNIKQVIGVYWCIRDQYLFTKSNCTNICRVH